MSPFCKTMTILWQYPLALNDVITASVWDINMKKWKKTERNVLEPEDRNSKEVSLTGELVDHGLKATLRPVWSENQGWVQNQMPKTEWLYKRIRL